MNTLMISIGLLVIATLIAVALHGVWQSYRGRKPAARRGAASTASAGPGAAPLAQPAVRERSEPSLGAIAGAPEPRASMVDDGPLPDHDFVEAAPDRSGSPESAGRLPAGHVSQAPFERAERPLQDVDLVWDASDATARESVAELAGEAVAGGTPAARGSSAHPNWAEKDSAAAGAVAQAASTASQDSNLTSQAAAVAAQAAIPASQAAFPAAAADRSASAEMPAATAQAAAAVEPDEPALNPRVDCIVEFALDKPLSGPRLAQAIQAIRRFGSKPVIFEGVLAQPAEVELASGQGVSGSAARSAESAAVEPFLATAQTWRRLSPDRAYRSLRMGVLLANRHGALNPMEFSEFAETARRLADYWGALAVVPDMTRTLETARALDVECIKLDAQLGLNIDAHEALSNADLQRIARDQRLSERGNNRFARLGPQDEVLFSLALGDRPNRLTLLLDVPRAPVEQQPWPALLRCAHETMTAVQGHLVDDSGRPLNTRNLDSLSAELAQRYAMLDQSGFKAGSALARRVFN